MNGSGKRKANGAIDSCPRDMTASRVEPAGLQSTLPAPPELPDAPDAALRRDGSPSLAEELGLVPRRRGRPRGTKNRVTREVREALRPALPKARRRLKQLVEHEDAEIALKAVTLVLAYFFGKPVERKEMSGPGGGVQALAIIKRVIVEPAKGPATAAPVIDGATPDASPSPKGPAA